MKIKVKVLGLILKSFAIPDLSFKALISYSYKFIILCPTPKFFFFCEVAIFLLYCYFILLYINTAYIENNQVINKSANSICHCNHVVPNQHIITFVQDKLEQ